MNELRWRVSFKSELKEWDIVDFEDVNKDGYMNRGVLATNSKQGRYEMGREGAIESIGK
jgi:hypothetical protein